MDTSKKPNEFRFSGYRLDVRQRKLYKSDDSEVNLSSRAFDTLFVLIERHGETLSKAELMKVVWPNVVVEENNLNQAISSLRKALGDSINESRFIQTVPGRGYCFIAELEASQNESPATPETAAADTRQSQSTQEVSSPEDRQNTKNQTFFYKVIGLSIAFCLILISTLFYLDKKQVLPETASLPALPDSIAVLPFTNLNPDDENQLFTLGLHDEVINQLSKIRSLNVISRDSVVALSNQQQSITELGSRLNVESVMTGTILFVEERARVSLQMLEPRTGITLWTTTYDADTKNLSDMISIQTDIATNVALALEAEINQQEKLAIEAIPTVSFEAYRYNLAAKNAYFSQDYEKTWALTNQALELDPNYLDALYLFSYVNTVLTAIPLSGMDSRQHYQQALDSAERFIAVAPEKSRGYALKASALGTDKQWIKIAEEVERLKSMDVPLSDMKFYGLILLCLGDFEGAIEILEANLMTEPVNLYGRGFLLAAYELSGNREKAIQEFQLGSELNPTWWGNTVNTFLSMGRNEPLLHLDNLVEISDDLKEILLNLDDRDRAIASLEEFLQQEHKISAETVYYGAIAAYVEEEELAVALMREALADAWLSFHWLWLPLFDEVRQLDSFKQLLRDSGIVDYWKVYGWPEVCQPEGESFSCDNWRAYP